MTVRTNARLAGFMFLFYIASGVAEMVLFAPATRGEGTAAKLASIAQHATLMRLGAVFSVVMVMNAFVLAVALYALTRDTDRDLALLALVCRIAEGLVGAADAFADRALLAVATAVNGPSSADAAAANVLGAALLKAQGLGTLLSATLFAIGSTLFAYLFLRGRRIPVSLSWLGIVSSLLLVVCLPLQMAGFLTGPVTQFVWIPIAVFEIVLALWLLIKGVT